MRINSSTALEGSKVLLVPYKKEHVPRYHEWMQSPDLLAQTASERLTLDQEYEMQQSWFQDENKCTFIVLDKQRWREKVTTEIDSMAGDVNLFFNDDDDPHTAEIEIMIAEPSFRGKGLGTESLMIMMSYGAQKLDVQKFTAKIGCSNSPSLMLFNKLGFKKVSVSEVFQEITLELPVLESTLSHVTCSTNHVTEHVYPLAPS